MSKMDIFKTFLKELGMLVGKLAIVFVIVGFVMASIWVMMTVPLYWGIAVGLTEIILLAAIVSTINKVVEYNENRLADRFNTISKKISDLSSALFDYFDEDEDKELTDELKLTMEEIEEDIEDFAEMNKKKDYRIDMLWKDLHRVYQMYNL